MSSRYLAREAPPELRLARAEGSLVFDAHGKRYIDFLMGWCVGNFGWGNAVIEEGAARYDGPDYVYPGFDYPPWEELAGLLVSIIPGRMARCFRATGGSEAVDLAMQAAMIATRRAKFVSLEGAYHGNTLATLSIGSSGNREKRPNLLRGCLKLKPPLDDRSLDRLERLLGKRDVAAVIMEAIPMNLGVLVPPEGSMREVQRLCRRHGTLLAIDEVATGFGRTGRLFASEHFGLEPDIVTVAKAVTDGVSGLGAMVCTGKVARAMQKDGAFYSTYGWHPRSTAVGIRTLRYVIENRERLLEDVAGTSEYFRARLGAIDFGKGAEVRVAGLAIAVEFNDEKRAQRMADRCRDRGLLVSPEGRHLVLIPALTIDRATAEEGLDIFEACAGQGRSR